MPDHRLQAAKPDADIGVNPYHRFETPFVRGQLESMGGIVYIPEKEIGGTSPLPPRLVRLRHQDGDLKTGPVDALTSAGPYCFQDDDIIMP